ncbi:MAG: amidohydrolase [Spirochaetes bacterium]|nr:amidohydrolase family protein [Deltaproteobacteria bacterium]RKY01761.1 MAG: amidohydrolase [Spirochaetota bacterium]
MKDNLTIIDSHVHLFSPWARLNRDELCKKEKAFSLLYKDKKAKMIGEEDLLRMMDEQRISKSVILGFPWEDSYLCRKENEYLLETAKQFPERLIPFITISFNDIGAAIEEIKHAIKNNARGIGELGFYQKRLSTKDIGDMAPIMDICKENNIPILMHVNELVGHIYPGKDLKNFRSIYEWIETYPDNKIILAHWGGGMFFYELMPKVKKLFKNIYYDTAASPYLYSPQVYKIALSIIGEDKIIFGTDYPLIPPNRYFKEIKEVIPENKIQAKILGTNIAQLIF